MTGMSEKIIRRRNKLDSGTSQSVPKLAIIDTIIPTEYDKDNKKYRFYGNNSLKKLNFDWILSIKHIVRIYDCQ